MKQLAGVAVSLAVLTACGGSSPDATAHFVSTVKAAYATAEAQENHGSRSATAWETFAITVQNTPAGKDAVQRGLLVAAARHASDAYTAMVRDSRCRTDRYLNGGAACPANDAGDPSRWEQRVAQLVDGLRA